MNDLAATAIKKPLAPAKARKVLEEYRSSLRVDGDDKFDVRLARALVAAIDALKGGAR